MTIKFDAHRIDIEDDFSSEISSLLRRVSEKAYNAAVDDVLDAIWKIPKEPSAAPLTIPVALVESKIRDLYVKYS